MGARHFKSASHLHLTSKEQVHRSFVGGQLACLLSQEQRTREFSPQKFSNVLDACPGVLR
jgi:hypothetical protein